MKKHSEQIENPIIFQHLDICCQKIAEQVGDKQISEWINSDYIKLSGLLSRKTKIQISESTLKRIFGKSKTPIRYYPQKATRNALAQFLGYKDWYEFELLNPVVKKITHAISEEEILQRINSPVKNKLLARFILFDLVIVVAILAIFISKPAILNYNHVTNVKLLCLNPDGQTPHSAIFKLAVNGNLPDSSHHFLLDFGDNRSARASFRDSIVPHYYEMPGRYYPILYFKNRPIDTGHVYLQSKGWMATAFNQRDTVRVYPVTDVDLSLREKLRVTAREAANAGVDTSRTFFITFANVKPTTIAGDNFELSLRLTTSANRAGIRCSQADIFIYGENDRHIVGIIKPECVAWTYYQFSENFKNGKRDDLRDLGHDLSMGAKLKLRIENKQVSLSVNAKEAFKTTYTKSIGKIMGIKISFAGIGSIDDFQLADLQTKEQF